MNFKRFLENESWELPPTNSPSPISLMIGRKEMRQRLYKILGVNSYRELIGISVKWTNHLGINLSGIITSASEEGFRINKIHRMTYPEAVIRKMERDNV